MKVTKFSLKVIPCQLEGYSQKTIDTDLEYEAIGIDLAKIASVLLC